MATPPASPTAPRLALLPGAAFALALAAALAAGGLTLARAPAAEWTGIAAARSLASGEAGARVSRILNEKFAPREAFLRIERGVSWLLLGDAGPRVRAGCPGWLFLRDEFDIHPDPGAASAARAAIAVRVREQLDGKGARLLLVVVPDKSRIEREQLCTLRRSPRLQGRVAGWIASLEAAGVEALDLGAALEALPGERYYRTDSHWNERGAEASALAVVQALRSRGLAGVAPPPAAEPARERVRRMGDLVRVAGLDRLPEGIGPGAEWTQRTAVPPPAAASDDLFGEAGLPKVAVVGTSFSRSANFVPFLARHLGEQVVNAAREGADFDGAARAYLEGATFRDAPPRVVIWEVPERAIAMPVKPDELRWLAALGGEPAGLGRPP